MTCFTNQNNGAEILLDYCSGTLAPEKVAAVDAHARRCAECQGLIEAQRSVFSALDAFEAPEVSADFDQRLYARIARENAQPGLAHSTPSWKRWMSSHFNLPMSISPAWWKPALGAGLAAFVLTVVLVMPSRNEAPRGEQGKQARIERHSDRIDMEQVERGLEDLDLLAPPSSSGPM